MTNFDDNLIFDRLADGELTLAERQELLSSLDRTASVDGWRRCALTLLETQTWRKEFKSFVKEEPLPTALRALNSEIGRVAAPTPLPARSFKPRWLGSSFALAASALVAFGVGWNLNAPEIPGNIEGDLVVNDTPVKPSIADSRDAVTLVVHDDQGKQQRVRLPLVDAGELGKQWAELAPDVPVDLKTGLRDYGFDLQSKRRFAPLFFEQNKQLVPMVVPVSDTYIVPVNRPVY